MSTQQKTPDVAESSEVSRVLAGGPSQEASGTSNGSGNPFSVSMGKSDAFVTIPSVGAYRTEDHRYYWNGKGPYPSVTTILKVLDKPAIVQWAKRTVAEFAVDTHLDGRLDTALGPQADREEAVKYLARLPDYQKEEAGKLGSGIHLLADMAARGAVTSSEGFQPSEQEKPYLDAFRGFLRWLEQQGAAIVSSEKMVWSINGYAGTYDLIVRMADELWLLDIKTSKGYYPEYALQLIAYGYADQIILEGNPDGYPMPKINRYGVLHLRPELYPDTGYRLIEYPLVEKDYIAFLAALELHQWKQEGRYTKSKLQKP